MNQDTSAHSADADSARRAELVRELQALMWSASIDELRAARMILRRFMGKGRESYGPLVIARDPRNFLDERAEEKADAFFYDVLEELRRYDERREAATEIAGSAPQRPSPTLAECKANFEATYGRGAPFDEPPVESLPPPPVVRGAHALMDFDNGDLDEETKR